MRRLLWMRRRSVWALIAAPVMAISAVSLAAGPAVAGSHVHHVTIIKPTRVNNLDCNAWSTKYASVNPSHRMLCTDPMRVVKWYDYTTHRWVYRGYPLRDNGHYVGHDEPSVKFISHAAGSGNAMSYFMKLPINPPTPPTPTGSVTTYAELSPAPWFGLPICDSNSYPQNPCKPDSDTNSGSIANPFAAGSAFMELQFYPPGFTPFQDNISCSKTQWCSAMNIDSLMCTFNFIICNPGCIEPVNFSFLQRNGVPTGPPSPQLANANTELANAQTLKMNSGDILQVSISDPKAGFTTKITDLTTGQSGFMVASAKNGFASTMLASCNGVPHTFHAEYNTASQQNQVPWAALEGGVLMQQEIGHFEVCNSVANQDPFVVKFPGGSSFVDKQVFDTCNGGSEGAKAVGEGPCSFTTFVCANAKTQGTTGPVACQQPQFTRGAKCEYADGICIKAGTRTVVISGKNTTQFQEISGCEDNRFQNGDLDYDGIPYQPNTWPNGSADTPQPAFYLGPFDATGKPYPQLQYETDAAGSEGLCNTFSGQDCTAPPLGAKFYPFWTLSKKLPVPGTKFSACFWNFGNVITGITAQTFGKDAQYGAPDIARFGGTLASKVHTNPEFTGKCPKVPLK